MFAWLVLGAVWIFNTTARSACPGLFAMMCLAIFQSCARVGCVLSYFKILFPEGVEEVLENQKAGPVPALPEQIAALPVETVHSVPLAFAAMGLSGEVGTCAVCLSEHRPGEQLRRLPCGHRFHVACCDQWLQRNKRCPLCVRAIDEAVSPEPMSRCPRRMKVWCD
jgi:hypothetical protein